MTGMAAIGGIGLIAGACSIHPLPALAPGVDTFDIVAQIRCEARSAVIDVVLEFLRGRDTPEARNVLALLQADEGKFRKFDV